MELLLTPLVTRVLKQFIKSSAEGGGRDLKVSFSRRGALTLHNLELNLDPLLNSSGLRAAVGVRRAFARRLEVTIPWTALTTQPIEVGGAGGLVGGGCVASGGPARPGRVGSPRLTRYQPPRCLPFARLRTQVLLDTVELVVALGGEEGDGSSPDKAAAAAGDAAAAAAAAGGSWFGDTLQSMALRAGLNVSLRVENVVVKCLHEDGGCAATLTAQSVALATAAGEGWREGLRNPEAWLKKELSVVALSLSLEELPPGAGGGGGAGGGDGGDGGGAALPRRLGISYAPLLRSPHVRASSLVPIYRFLEVRLMLLGAAMPHGKGSEGGSLVLSLIGRRIRIYRIRRQRMALLSLLSH